MQPLIPLQEQDRARVEAGYEEQHSSEGGGWGGLVLLVILVVALAAAIWFFGSMEGTQGPTDQAPSEAPLDPGY